MSREVQPCGTYAGYQRHKKNKEEACEPCKVAHKAYMDNWNETHPETRRSYDRARPYRRRDPEKRRSDKLKYAYGITAAQWNEIFEWQDNRCACCGTDVEHDRQKPWQVDHDHETGIIRGIICSRCNRLLAQAGDNAYGVAATFARLFVYLAASGDVLTDEQHEAMFDAIRRGRRLVGEGEADPDRKPQPRHESDLREGPPGPRGAPRKPRKRPQAANDKELAGAYAEADAA